jgi:hypothetical protein
LTKIFNFNRKQGGRLFRKALTVSVSSFEPLKGRSSYRELLGFVKVCFLRFFFEQRSPRERRSARLIREWLIMSGVFLYYPGRRQDLPKLRAFIEHVKYRGADAPRDRTARKSRKLKGANSA